MTKQFTLKRLIAIIAFALALPLANTAFAHDGKSGNDHCHKHAAKHHGGGHHGGFGRGGPHYLHGLQLSDAQKDQLFALKHAEAPAVREMHQARVKLHEALRANSLAEPFDDNKAQQLAGELANVERDQTLLRARSEAKVLAILTPEQRAQVREFKAREFREHGAKHRKDGGRGERTGFHRHHHHEADHNHRRM